MMERKDIEKLFGKWLGKISDSSLRERVVNVWIEGCKKGGWASPEDLQKMPFTLVTDPMGINFVEHTLAVTEGAVGLAKAQMETYAKMPFTINMDRLIAGALLHDVGKLLEIVKDDRGNWKMSRAGQCLRHPLSGMILAREAGLPDELLNVIGCHAKEGEGASQVVETVLIHQADFATFNPLVMLKGGKLIP